MAKPILANGPPSPASDRPPPDPAISHKNISEQFIHVRQSKGLSLGTSKSERYPTGPRFEEHTPEWTVKNKRDEQLGSLPNILTESGTYLTNMPNPWNSLGERRYVFQTTNQPNKFDRSEYNQLCSTEQAVVHVNTSMCLLQSHCSSIHQPCSRLENYVSRKRKLQRMEKGSIDSVDQGLGHPYMQIRPFRAVCRAKSPSRTPCLFRRQLCIVFGFGRLQHDVPEWLQPFTGRMWKKTSGGRKQANLRSRPTKTQPKFHEKTSREKKKDTRRHPEREKKT